MHAAVTYWLIGDCVKEALCLHLLGPSVSSDCLLGLRLLPDLQPEDPRPRGSEAVIRV